MMRAFAFLLGLLCCAPIWAATYHATATGAGAADGSSRANAFAGLAAGVAALSAGDRLCIYDSFVGTAHQQVSGTMFRLAVAGTSLAVMTNYHGDCDGDGVKAIIDCNSQVGIGIRATNGTVRTNFIRVEDIVAQNCTNKIVVTYQTVATEFDTDANQVWFGMELYNANGGGAGHNCFDSRGRYIELRLTTIDGCDEDAAYHQGKYFRSDFLTVRHFSRRTAGGDGLQIAAEGDGYWVSNFDCDHRDADTKQCFIASVLSDTGAGGIFEDFETHCFPSGTVSNCIFVTGDGARIRRGWVTGGNYGVAIEGSADSTNMDLSSLIVSGATTHNVAVFSGAGANNRITQSAAVFAGGKGFMTADSDVVTFRNNWAAWNGGCGFDRANTGTQLEDHNLGFGNGTDFCGSGSSTAAGTGSLAVDPEVEGGTTPRTPMDFAPRLGSPLIGGGTRASGMHAGYNCGFDPMAMDVGPIARCAGQPRATLLPARTTPLSPAP